MGVVSLFFRVLEGPYSIRAVAPLSRPPCLPTPNSSVSQETIYPENAPIESNLS